MDRDKLMKEVYRDFKDQDTSKEVANEGHPVIKFLNYKVSKTSDDCDKSEWAKEIYEKLWPDVCRLMTGDTMNSFWNTYKVALQLYYPEVFGNVLSIRKRPTLLDLERLDFRRFDKVNELKYMQKFAVLTHTIGNLVLVPEGFNTERSLKTCDYWDLSLELLRVKLGEKMYRQYILTFFLEDCIDSNFEPVKLFDGHSMNNRLPGRRFDISIESERDKAKQELAICVNTINERIIKRGARMVMMLNSIGR